MRYAQCGGYTPAEQQRRERLRVQAAERFARGDGINEIAHDLRVMPGSVRRWRRAWQDGGTAALRSRGCPGTGPRAVTAHDGACSAACSPMRSLRASIIAAISAA